MRGCSVHYHQTLDLAEAVDVKLIDPPRAPIRDYRDGISELVSSISEKGLILPIIVRPVGRRFEVVSGARRLEACRKLRWGRVACIVKELSDQDSYEIALTENLQRKTMNAIEEALAFKKYIDQKGWGGETFLARKIGKSQEYVSQRLALLSLPSEVKQKIIRRQIKPSIAQEIARIQDPKKQLQLAQEAEKNHLTVGIVRETAKSINQGQNLREAVKNATNEPDEFENQNEYNDVPFALEIDESDYPRGKNDPLYSRKGAAVRDLEKSILVLKLALLRIDGLIGGMPEKDHVKNVLLQKRVQVHDIIDSLIREKIRVSGMETYPVIRR
jgi:ParB family chromosome partitioning protein